MIEKIRLGDVVRDVVTGFTGTATARVEYLNGCVQFSVTPKCEKPNEMPDNFYIDQQQLTVIARLAREDKSEMVGGPQSNTPPRQRGLR